MLLPRSMGYPLRWNRTDLLYEVVLTTIQGRHLLRPSPEVSDIILGVMSRAQRRYLGIRVYGFFFDRNEARLLLSSANEVELPRFMAYLASGISRRLGRLLDWSGKLWARRYRSVPILDEEAITMRLRHLLSGGVAEGLVASPRAWPGATCVPALVGSMVLEGAWVNRDREAELRALGLDPPASAYVEPYRVVLSPLPAWAHLPAHELTSRYRAMIDSIELEHLMQRQGDVPDPLALQQQDPFFRPPRAPHRRLAQLCHATCARVVDGFRAAYRQFCSAFRAAGARLRGRSTLARSLLAGFPAGSNPRPELHVPWPDRPRSNSDRGLSLDEARLIDVEETVLDEVPAQRPPKSPSAHPPAPLPAPANPASAYHASPAKAAFTAAERARPYAGGGQPWKRAPVDAPSARSPRALPAPMARSQLSAYRTSRPDIGRHGRIPDIPDVRSRT